MDAQMTFKRYELKYMLSRRQTAELKETMEGHLALDQFGHSVIRNIYFDTDSYRLIRRSIEKPAYKEKLRMRSYKRTTSDSPVFVELKKKYKGVVYKRRVSLPEEDALNWLCQRGVVPEETQITNEIQYFMEYYETLHPTVFLSYEREAYYAKDGSSFRITFDDHILCRRTNLSLQDAIGGTPILEDGLVLMEIKCAGGIPLWLTQVLSREHIYKTSFSKYGTAYQKLIYPTLKEDSKNGNII